MLIVNIYFFRFQGQHPSIIIDESVNTERTNNTTNIPVARSGPNNQTKNS